MNFEIVGSVDVDSRRSKSGYVFNLFNGLVTWISKKQSVAILSFTETEYMAFTYVGI